VAVHPLTRAMRLVVKTITCRWCWREIPIRAPMSYVDPAFGTGCVQAYPRPRPQRTSGHSAPAHGLPSITVMAKDGTMNAAAGRFAGLDRFEARTGCVAAMGSPKASW